MTIYRDQLEAVYRLIEKPDAWTTGAYARNEGGDDLGNFNSSSQDDANHPAAACWCLAGAAIKAGAIKSDRSHDGAGELAKLLCLPNPWIHEFNDNHTHAEVLAALKDAIDRAPVRP